MNPSYGTPECNHVICIMNIYVQHVLTYKFIFGYSLLKTVHHSYLILTPWTRVLGKLTNSQLVKKFPTFYGTQRFITAFIRACQLSLSWGRLIHSMSPHPTSWRSIVTLSSHLSLGLPSGFFPSGFPTKTMYAPLLSPIHDTFPTHLILLDFITRMLGEE